MAWTENGKKKVHTQRNVSLFYFYVFFYLVWVRDCVKQDENLVMWNNWRFLLDVCMPKFNYITIKIKVDKSIALGTVKRGWLLGTWRSYLDFVGDFSH
jgi:hypothetical protein